jgi:hypothetical protein
MKKIFVVLSLGVLSLVACASTQPSAEPPTPVVQEAAAPASPVVQEVAVPSPTAEKPAGSGVVSADLDALKTAYNLAKYGYRTESASALITAAEMLAQVQTQPLGAEAEVSEAAVDEGVKEEKPEFTPVNLLADARKFAAGDTALLTWADDVEAIASVATRGALGGARYQVDRVKAGGTVSYQIPLRTDYTEILVSGDGDTDLDLYLYDSSGKLIAYDEDYGDDCRIYGYVDRTGTYTIIIKNRGSVYNQFEIATN